MEKIFYRRTYSLASLEDDKNAIEKKKNILHYSHLRPFPSLLLWMHGTE